MSEQLKPCPHCGEKYPAIVHYTIAFVPHAHSVECPKCGASTKVFEDEAEAIVTWNRRVPTLSAEIKETIRKALEKDRIPYANRVNLSTHKEFGWPLEDMPKKERELYDNFTQCIKDIDAALEWIERN